ncbi:MAG: aminotransferase class III-fold pyridoxal phosphate-dependent enzyme [Planctomycetota bacterium]|nr:MAG: aminotransferase class III-fold pyridoxal phosphate-dependent enzyme [Planctomycetota bacterium]
MSLDPSATSSASSDAPRGERTQAAYRRARQILPGGTQLLSKRPEMYAPGRWPAYYAEARGTEVVDLDGKRYRDMSSMGIGSCLLGYADPDVTAAVVDRVERGSMCSLNNVEELELAELLLSIHPWAEQARFCRTGGESMAVAVRLARASRRRDRVAFCGYHGWSDWYLAANLPREEEAENDPLDGHLLPGLPPLGVPAGLAGTALPFAYNRLDELERIVSRYGDELAAVVMEPVRHDEPAPGFLAGARELCDACGAALVFDEITSGWRMTLGGAHLKYGVTPDVAVFAKALGSGHPIAAIIGVRGVMDAAQDTFVSSTYWTEGVGYAAALATIRKMMRVDVPGQVATIGKAFRAACHELAEKHGVPLRLVGFPALQSWRFEHEDAAALATLLTTRMLDRGFLVGVGFYPTLAHDKQHVAEFRDAADDVFAELGEAARRGDAASRLDGPARHTGFARLT